MGVEYDRIIFIHSILQWDHEFNKLLIVYTEKWIMQKLLQEHE